MTANSPAPPSLTLNQGRLLVFLAAVLWSLSGFFKTVLTYPTWLGLEEPPLSPLQIAVFRSLFAGVVLLPLVRPSEVRVCPLMLLMLAFFALMNWTYMTALTQGPAAQAVLLQYTAPLWVILAGVYVLREPVDRRNAVTVAVGLAGAVVLIAGNAQQAESSPRNSPWVIGMGLSSGLAYAGVLICLRLLREVSAAWLTLWNHLGAGLVLLPTVVMLPWPTLSQLLFLALFGAVQMGLPYWLIARSLRVVSPQEVGAITLIEPLLLPLWAYLLAPDIETPTLYTWLGGGCILAALAWRYAPRRSTEPLASKLPQ
jgi:DME family drug/metabolite transporter